MPRSLKAYLQDSASATSSPKPMATGALSPGRPLIVPLKAYNASGVSSDGYQTVPILCYTSFPWAVRPSDDHAAGLVPGADGLFEEQRLPRHHACGITSLLERIKPIPLRSVVITVDDGFRSGYDIAYPS